MKRTLAEWASVAEIIGALAIVVSLVFVGLQIRANTRATQNATYQQSVGYEIEILNEACTIYSLQNEREYVFTAGGTIIKNP